jgi:hypothetical protein
MKLVYAAIVALSLTAAVFAELPFKKKPQPFTTHSPSLVAHTLSEGTAAQINDLALELGMFAANPSKPGMDSNSPCVNFSHMDSRPVALQAGKEIEMFVADSRECSSIYFVVFEKVPKSDWQHVQTVRLPAAGQRPEISFAELIQPGVSEILVHKEITLDGGGSEQQNFVILKLLGDRLEIVMDETERSELTLANRTASETDNFIQTQNSTFDLLKSPLNSPASYRLLEKQVITDNKTTITRFRVWTWDPELGRFRSAPFEGGNARPSPPARKNSTDARPK